MNIPKEIANKSGSPIQIYRNKDFLAQVFIENGELRLSVNRTQLNKNGDWRDDISWDELFMIKNACLIFGCIERNILLPLNYK